MDRAASALYEPGSVFKIVTLSAAIDQRIVNPDDVIDCQNGAIYIAGHRIRDHKPFGLLTVSQVLANSSDVGAIKVGLRLGAPKFYDYIRAFGFGQPTGVDLPGESRGMLRRVENWTPVSTGSVSMGQEIGVTPLQLITAMSALANGGVVVRPHVVLALRRGTRMVEPPQPQPRRVIRPTTAATMRRMLEGVVLNGTGKLARLDGYTTAGKTGTAQKFDPGTGRYSIRELIASFVGFAPINTPAITVLVTLDSAVGLHQGGQVAAPVFKRVGPSEISVSGTQEPAAGTPAPTVEFAEGEAILVPAFEGKAVREVTEECTKLGLNPVLVGTGIAIDQSPGAGATIRRGSRITVQFARGVLASSAAHRRGDR
jgi:cell division protein FtsI (penicillin-binding protein 3)